MTAVRTTEAVGAVGPIGAGAGAAAVVRSPDAASGDPHDPVAVACRAFLGRFDDLCGYQLHVRHRGRTVVDLAVGVDALDRRIQPDSLQAVYCATKPVVAVALAVLVARGELDHHDRLLDRLAPRDRHDLHPAFADVRLDHLLTHTAGLHGYRALDHLLLPPDLRRLAVLRSRPRPRGPLGSHSAYAEYVPWYLLGLVLEHATGQSVSAAVGTLVTEPLGIDDEVLVGIEPAGPAAADAYVAVEPRLRVGLDVSGRRPVPLLLEVGRRFVTEPNPAPVGGLCSARGLARFYQALLDVRAGRSSCPLPPSALRALLVERTDRAYDPVLARPAGFGRGFMVDLTAHDMGTRCTPSSFGHGGFAANAWAFADPAHELVVAFSQTARFDVDRAIHAVRVPLVDLLYEQLLDQLVDGAVTP